MTKKSRLIVLASCAFAMGLGFSLTAIASDPEGDCLFACWQEYRQCNASGYFTPEQCEESYRTCKLPCDDYRYP